MRPNAATVAAAASAVAAADGRRFLLIASVCWLLFACDMQRHSVHGSGFGRCPKYPSMPKFNMTRFLGVWYELERSFYMPEIISSCTTITFRESATDVGLDDKRLDVSVRSINLWTGSPSENRGHATTETTRSSIMDFQLETRLPSVIAGIMPGSGKYQVLYTDYDNFAILWSCGSIASLTHADQIWLLRRTREDFNVDTRTLIHGMLRKLGLDPERLLLSKNKNCGGDDNANDAAR